jgi:hypothetical protein
MLIALLAILLFAPALFLDTERYAAFSTAAQALGVFLALILAAATLQSQNRAAQVSVQEQVRIDRVGRTLEFHRLFTGGEINAARSRLIGHLRVLHAEGLGQHPSPAHTNGGPVRPVSLTELREDRRIAVYTRPETDGTSVGSPIGDAYSMLWYFERAEAALRGGLLEEGLFHKLLGRHIAWWDQALVRDGKESMRSALAQLGDWIWEYSDKNPEAGLYARSWEATLAWGFPKSRFGAASKS